MKQVLVPCTLLASRMMTPVTNRIVVSEEGKLQLMQGAAMGTGNYVTAAHTQQWRTLTSEEFVSQDG